MENWNKVNKLAEIFKAGRKIRIKPSHKGLFTDYCGGKVTSECIARGKSSPNPAIRKRATFAANARKWKHAFGGSIEGEETEKYEPTLEDIIKFASSFEAFKDTPYQIPNYKGEMQTLAGFGSANPKIIDLASQGKLTREIALDEVRDHFNKIYNRLSVEVPGFNNLPMGARLGIADIVYNGSGVDSFKKKNPNLIQAINLYDASNPDSLQAVVSRMSHSKNAGGWLGVRSSARRAMALGKYDWNWPTLDKYGRQVDYTQYKGPQDWKSSPYYQKYAKGGNLIYTSLGVNNQEDNYGLTYKPFLKPSKQVSDLQEIDDLIYNYTPSFPVVPVETYEPVEGISMKEIPIEKTSDVKNENSPETKEIKTSQHEIQEVTSPRNTTAVTKNIEKILGTVEYKTSNMDVGNMQELIDLMRDEGISFRVTSGKREGAKTSNGSKSHHSMGNAIDITPIKGQSWEDLIAQMKRSSKFLEYMRSHGLGILDERSKEMLARTGGTGAHFHIGPDKAARQNFITLFG